MRDIEAGISTDERGLAHGSGLSSFIKMKQSCLALSFPSSLSPQTPQIADCTMALVRFPPVFELKSKIEQLAPGTWPTFIDYCVIHVQASLKLSPTEFASLLNPNSHLLEFLISFEKNVLSEGVPAEDGDRLGVLRRQCFLLGHRVFIQCEKIPSELLTWDFLSKFVLVHRRSRSLKPLIDEIWKRTKLESSQELQQHKRTLVNLCSDAKLIQGKDFEDILAEVMAFLKASSSYANFLMLGSDFVDSLSISFSRAANDLRNRIVGLTFTALASLVHGNNQASLLIDHLYSLKSFEDSQSASKSLLSRLAASTPLISMLEKHLSGLDLKRAESLISYLKLLRDSGTASRPPLKRKKYRDKGKAKESVKGSEWHVHKMSLVSQIQDLFPHLGSGFIAKLLDEYQDDTEQVTSHLLDDSLPNYLKTADRSENIEHSPHDDNDASSLGLAPRSTPPKLTSRRNVFDDDDFDNLAIDMSKVHVGRKNANLTADDLLADRSTAPKKAAILSALAAFDADDDERDDSYDIEDVGGTVDSAPPGIDEVTTDAQDKNEETLFKLYKSNPEVFNRSSDTRRSKIRETVKRETGLTDEGLEGWAIMLGRDPRKLRNLEAKYSTEVAFRGNQRELGSTAYREGTHDSGTEPEDGAERGDQRGPVKGRRGGRERGRGGQRGGNVAGPANEDAIQRARQRKDANKSSRANHHRRDQRARKIFRAGFPG